MIVPGQLAVNQSGAATYSIPISVPPGTAGVAPVISLDYSSQSGDGIVGLGWMLSGLETIDRCPRTLAQDSVHGGVNYDANDRFCFEGQRLVAISGTYGASGTEYRTENESFSRIISYGTAGTGPSYFKVWTKGGQLIEFGNTTDSRPLAVGKTTARIWAANKISDPKGNYLTVTYINDAVNGQIYPSRIDYTGHNTAPALAPYNSVQFVYNAARPDVTPTYQAGSLQQTTVLLTDVKTYQGASSVYDYKLAYRLGSSTTHSRITSITLCDGSGANCLAPTTFGWQGGTGTLASTAVANGTSQNKTKQPADFNGDGLTDLVDGSGCIFLNSQAGTFASGISVNGAATNVCFFYAGTGGYKPYVTDIDGDGFSDIIGLQLVQVNPNVSYYNGYTFLNNRSNLLTRSAASTTSVGPGNPFFPADFSGDGRSDVYNAQLSWGNGDGTFTAHSGPTWTNYGPPPLVGDFDGDGCADIGIMNSPGGTQTLYYQCGPAVATATLPNWQPYKITAGDFNGDGKTDNLLSNSSGATLYLSTGTGLSAGYTVAGLPTPTTPSSFQTGDFNGDGKTDIAVVSLGQAVVWLSTGSGFVQSATVPYNSSGDTTIDASAADWNNDGATDLWIQKASGDTQILFTFSPELLTSVANGIGATSTIGYDRLNKNGTFYVKGTGSVYPTRDVDGPIYVVSRVDSSNGIGGLYTTTYAYAGAKANVLGRGLLGIGQVTISDPQTGIAQTTNYRTDLPYAGLISSQIKSYGAVTLSSLIKTYADTSLGSGTDGVPRHLLSLTNSVESGKDLDGSTLPTTTTNYSYDAYGNALTINVSLSDGSSKNSTNTYNNDATNWILGQLTSTSVTSTVGASVITRTSSIVHDPATGLITQEVAEPSATTCNGNNTSCRLQTDYTYDAFGHRLTTTISGAGTTTRSTSAGYDAIGEFQTSTTNALSQTEYIGYDARFGTPTTRTDLNGLITGWSYDALGRKTQEIRADGNKVAISGGYCSGINGGTAICPAGAALLAQATPQNSVGVQNGASKSTYFDNLGRVVAVDSQGFDGGVVRTGTQYDAKGRVLQTSRPYFIASGSPAWMVFSYDALGRTTQTTEPNGAQTVFGYHGLTTSVTNNLAQARSTVKNAQGLNASITDPANRATTYIYDAYGNLLSTTDPAGNVISNTYDIRGNKIGSTDPDLGHWTYVYDVLGELVSQTDAKGQTTSLTYDLLGRLAGRSEADLLSSWTYGASAASHNVGALVEAKACAASGCGTVVSDKTFSYDSLGRLSTTTIAIDGSSYGYATTYDPNGRISTVTNPSGLTTANVYTSLGYLSQIKDNGSGVPIWTITSRDAELHPLSQAAGNGVVQTNTYDANTGRPVSVRAGPSNAVASFDFGFDTIGNLTSRSDNLQSVSDKFCYDNLNRLTEYAAGNAVTACTTNQNHKTVFYDQLGNITSKSDVGSYAYPTAGASRVHAVTSITGTVNGVVNPTYGYDANGNMMSGAGRATSWTSFNMAASIVQGSATVSLIYDSEHRRIKQVAPTGTTTYLNDPLSGTIEEKLVSGTTTWLDYIQADGRIVAKRSAIVGGATSWTYVVADHLGSTAVITNAAGAVVERDAYDAWGKRRNLNGSDDMSCSLISSTTRGYTGHEHIDADCLINANARIYDPTVARFMSPDDIIPDSGDGQSFNRYSYVNNRPLSLVDPTGNQATSSPVVGTEIVVTGRNSNYFDSNHIDPGNIGGLAGIGGSYSGLTSFGTSATSLAAIATSTSTAASVSTGGSKAVNDQNNRFKFLKLTTFHWNADGSVTTTVRYAVGVQDANGTRLLSAMGVDHADLPRNVGLLTGDHDYTAGPNLICPASWGCSASLVGSTYSQISNAIPGNTSAGSIVSGSSYTVRLAGVPIGEVQSYVGSGGLTINNITQWDHVLAQGFANRNAFQLGGSWYSFTHGSGTNYYGGAFMAVVNQLAGPGIFNSLDRSIANQLYDATHH